MNRSEEEHKITGREMAAWQNKPKKAKHDLPKLTVKQQIEFLKCVAQLSTSSIFERKFGLNAAQVEEYKKLFDVESQDDARRKYRKLEIEQFEGREDYIISETTLARKAEDVANARLKELAYRKALEAKERADLTPDANAVRADDATRQRRFQEEQVAKEQEALSRTEPWALPLSGSDFDKKDMIERFRKDIENCGLVFCMNKYQASPIQIKAEAGRLNLRINWDRIKR